jgi:Ion channel
MTAMLVGFGVTLGALVIQGVAVTLGVEAIGALMAKRVVGIHLWRNGMATLMLIVTLLTGHLAQMAVWATTFMAAGQFETFAVAFYHSAVNYTSLGYGDLVMSERWRLLGPQEAVSGTLAFGWSTAAIVTIVIRLLRHRHSARMRRAQVREGISRALAKNS